MAYWDPLVGELDDDYDPDWADRKPFRPTQVPFNEAEAAAGLIAPEFVARHEPDLTDPEGWFDRIDVTDAGSSFRQFMQGEWHGRTIEVQHLVWRPTPEWQPVGVALPLWWDQ